MKKYHYSKMKNSKTTLETALLDVYKSYPYKVNNYNDKFISLKVLKKIHTFCKENPIVEKIYAKGSIVYGTMINGSDIDHLRIKTRKPLSLKQKRNLVDSFKEALNEFNISKIQRIEEQNYIRVFYDYLELKDYPLALTIKDEIYPEMHIIRAKTKKKYIRKIIRRAYRYSGGLDDKWIEKYKERFKLL